MWRVAEIKFCGLTRVEDAAFAAPVGGAFAGVIFAGGPRELTAARAAEVLGAAAPAIRRVGVFGADFRSRIPDVLRVVSLQVVQLHGDPTVADVRAAREIFGGTVWAAVRVVGTEIPDVAAALFGEADAVLVDAKAPGRLGGSGVRVPWPAVADRLTRIRAGATLVLAGGLSPENVEDAMATLLPDVVDVSSGVEVSPGVKDHERMTAFVHAVQRSAP